ncbi:uncharacterized protein EDB91DRAFT_1237346 [Suillus paluster]|uniref:uncharacterized protein n=1 Tax=Suillus paluster TaxID=48578 RepID=UPI001B87BD3B|nr:uncharacterized protein EDB91DRAFT_1237346 [Suillus paluster]KAG1740110.1 hypothetical protein EDB91DRAFT_1237346 [Suillus paluster]
MILAVFSHFLNIQDDPQKQWVPECDNFLEEFIRLEGRGDDGWSRHYHGEQGCINQPFIWCIDCEGLQLYCQSCVISLHCTMPLHRVEIWSGNYFQCSNLRDLGLRIHLGHPTGVRCCNPSAAFQDDFTVLDITGVHSVMLDFCNCETAQTHATQLLCTRCIGASKDRYEAFLWMTGHGHDTGGALDTMEGELTVLCPACPQPGKNLPLDWETNKAQHKWLYALFLAMDANFRLYRHNKSSEQANPSLSRGWGYFIEQNGFKDVLDAYVGQVQEKSSCTSHNAVNLAETKNSRGLAATGVGTIICAHHNLTRPSSVGDLQKRERYVSRTYLMMSIDIRLKSVPVLNISYDIACQWGKHLLEWMSRYPSWIHFLTHIEACQTLYSLNLIKGMARTDSEAIECRWSNMNPVATSTHEMGPGSRCHILDDHFGDWNWRQVSNLGPSLLKKLKEAIPECYQHAADLHDFEEAIPSSSLSTWHKLPNPFEIKASVVTQASLEAHQLRQGSDTSLHPEVSPSVLITVRIDLEALQHRLTTDTANIGIHATDNQLSTMQQCTNALCCQIEQWMQIQTLYIPNVARLRTNTSDAEDATLEEPAHTIKLWMLSAVVKAGMSCDVNLCNIEWKLRCAKTHDGLQELQQHLRIKCHLNGFKKNWLMGQQAHTRSCAVIDTVVAKIAAAATKYRTAWSTLHTLADALLHFDWEIEFPRLEDGDICGMTEEEVGGLVSEGRRLMAMSWIWKQHHGVGEEELSEAMRIEWCKAGAHAKRWAEEVELVQEEMRRYDVNVLRVAARHNPSRILIKVTHANPSPSVQHVFELFTVLWNVEQHIN